MKRISFALCVLVTTTAVTVLVILCSKIVPSGATTVRSGAKLVCPAEVSIGDREAGEIVLVPFTLRNAGDELLVIDRVQTSCSCTGLEVDKAEGRVALSSLAIAPGSTQDVYVRVAVRGRNGQMGWNTTIGYSTNELAKPRRETVIVCSKVLGGILLEPPGLVFEKGVNRLSLAVWQPVRMGIAKYEISCAGSTFKAAWRGDDSLDDQHPGFRRVGYVDVEADQVATATNEGELTLVARFDQHTREYPIAITRFSQPDLDVLPRKLVLPQRRSGNVEFSGRFMVLSATEDITSIEVSEVPAGVKIDVEIGENRRRAVLLVRADRSRGARDAAIQVVTPSLKVPFSLPILVLDHE